MGADSHRLLLPVGIQAAGLHFALHPAHHHSHRRLSFPAQDGGTEPLGAAGPCGAVRRDDHGRAAAALVCGPWPADAADDGAAGGGDFGDRRGAADLDCGERLRRGQAAAGHLRSAGSAAFLPLWCRPVLRQSGHCANQAGDSPAGPLLLRAPAGRAAGQDGSRRRDGRGLSRAARRRIRAVVLSQSRGGQLRGGRRAG